MVEFVVALRVFLALQIYFDRLCCCFSSDLNAEDRSF
jgi:hypothetical protein